MSRRIPLDVQLGRGDTFLLWLAGKLPRRLVYMVGLVIVSYATSGRYHLSNLEELRAMVALRRWAYGNDKR